MMITYYDQTINELNIPRKSKPNYGILKKNMYTCMYYDV